MLAYIIRRENDISDLPTSAKAVAFTFRPSMETILETLEKAKRINVIMISDGYTKSMGTGTKRLLKLHNIELRNTPEQLQGRHNIDNVIEFEESKE
jgi:aconitase B